MRSLFSAALLGVAAIATSLSTIAPVQAEEFVGHRLKRAQLAAAWSPQLEALLDECRYLRSSGLGPEDDASAKMICDFLEREIRALRTWLPGGDQSGALGTLPRLSWPGPKKPEGARERHRTDAEQAAFESRIEAFGQALENFLKHPDRAKW